MILMEPEMIQSLLVSSEETWVMIYDLYKHDKIAI